ncbi:MAG: GatB/YqeY domain-containing protein [bacterium]
MNDFQNMSQNLVKSLSLQYEPVGVALYLETDQLPADLAFTQKEYKSYCHALVAAGEGEVLLLKKEQMGCKLGTSVLGLENDMEAYLDDGVLEKYGVGLFETEEASAATILKSSYLEKGKTQAALVAPLSYFKQAPQVVVFTANSEQVMWLLYALNYEKGGRMELAQQEAEEIAIIEEFMPEQMNDDDIAAAIDAVIDEAQAATLKDMGKVMSGLKEKHAGSMDFSKASAMVKERLS